MTEIEELIQRIDNLEYTQKELTDRIQSLETALFLVANGQEVFVSQVKNGLVVRYEFDGQQVTLGPGWSAS